MNISVVTIATENRLHRVRLQRESLGQDPRVTHHAIRLESGGRLPLAKARNEGAQRAIDAGAEVIVFLDADCIAAPTLIEAYARAAQHHPQALLAGPVTYLTEAETNGGIDAMRAHVHPHAARPNPPAQTTLVWTPEEGRQGRYDLFWSLSFAVTATTWHRIGGFDESYVGYGGEDTDFAYRAHRAGVPLVWVGGANALHMWHPVSSPPVEHLDDILQNGRHFARQWGVWPMLGWLEAFASRGLVTSDDEGNWHRTPDSASRGGAGPNATSATDPDATDPEATDPDERSQS